VSAIYFLFFSLKKNSGRFGLNTSSPRAGLEVADSVLVQPELGSAHIKLPGKATWKQKIGERKRKGAERYILLRERGRAQRRSLYNLSQ